MSPLEWILAAILAVPLLELAIFIAVARQIGTLAALALALATSVLGIALLKAAGRGKVSRMRVAVAEGMISDGELRGPSLFTVMAGILLFVPGFLTDLLGLLVLLPPVQQGLRTTLRRLLGSPAQGRDGVVDLAPSEWNRIDNDPSDRPGRDLPRP